MKHKAQIAQLEDDIVCQNKMETGSPEKQYYKPVDHNGNYQEKTCSSCNHN